MTSKREKVEEAFGDMVHPLAVLGVHGNEAEKELANKISGLILAHDRGDTQPAGGDPVAWARQCDLDESDPAIFVAREEFLESGYDIPLYTAAPPAAAPVATGEPKGWRLVPIEPLMGMMSDKDYDTRITAERTLLAMLDKAPPAAAHGDEVVAFANELINGALEGGDFCGADIQELAVKHGLLREERREEPCREEGCACAEYGFPTECYRKTAALAAMRAQAGEGGEV